MEALPPSPRPKSAGPAFVSALPSAPVLSPRHSMMAFHRTQQVSPVAGVLSAPVLPVAAAPPAPVPEEKEEASSFFLFPPYPASVAEADEEVAAQMLYVDVRATRVWRAVVSPKGATVAALFLLVRYLTGVGVVSLLLWAFAGVGFANWVLRRQWSYEPDLPLELLQVAVVGFNSVMRGLHGACNLVDMDKAIGVVAMATLLVWIRVL